MKRKKMLSSMDLIDDKYIEEADPDKGNAKNKRRSLFLRFGALAASAAIIISGLAAWLFIPFDQTPPDVTKYSGDQYYPLIQKLNELTFKVPNYTNRFELYTDVINFSPMAKEEAADNVGVMYGEANYVETTDNQVSGVIEADLIKRSDRHIFYLRGNILSVYPINGLETECIATYTVSTSDNGTYYYGAEMFLSEDCSTLSVILPCYSGYNNTTQIVSLDVTDPTNIGEKGRISVSGAYVSSRVTAGKLLLVTNFAVKGTPDFSDVSTFIPQVTTKDGVITPEMDNIMCPENATSPKFAVVTMIDPLNTDLIGTVACLSYSYNIYASTDSVYLTRSYTHRTKNGNIETVTPMSEITRVAFSDSALEIKGSFLVNGSIKDQYSLDEYEGVLRVATTTSSSSYECEYDSNNEVNAFCIISSQGPNASLYCFDKESFEMLASVENFAPEGEQIQSTRFDRNEAYICTSVQLSDPVFFFDLSDFSNITYKDTGTIEGFSSSLINFGNGYLLGIGVGSSWNTVKIEVYEETESGVSSVCNRQIVGASYSTEYKSYFIDRENGLLGLMIYPNNGQSYYLLLHFNGASLTTVLKEPAGGNFDRTRALLIENCFYIFTDQEFKVKAMN